MKGNEIDKRSIGIVTVGIEGFWSRLSVALHILFTGEATFGIMPENFIEEGERPDGTTCIYRVDPEELMAPHMYTGDDGDDHVCIGDPPEFARVETKSD